MQLADIAEKCVDDNLTVAGSIVETMAGASFGAQTLYIYMKDVACISRIEGGIKAAITMIILTIVKNISKLIVNNGFLIDKLINKYEIAQITFVQYICLSYD